MRIVYPNLVGEIAKRGIRRKDIASVLGISERALYTKLSGRVSFTWDEVVSMTERFFPGMNQMELFRKAVEEKLE